MAQLFKDGYKHLFFSMDSNTYNESTNFTFSTKYYKEADNRIVGIRPYLYREHGDSIIQFFSP